MKWYEYIFAGVLVILLVGSVINLSSSDVEVVVECEEKDVLITNYTFQSYVIKDLNDDITYRGNKQIFCVDNIFEASKPIGKSMQPTFFEGNTLLKRRYTEDTKLEVGQIISFRTKDKVIVHRIISIQPDKVITKGDNNILSEEVEYDKINYVIVGILFTK